MSAKNAPGLITIEAETSFWKIKKDFRFPWDLSFRWRNLNAENMNFLFFVTVNNSDVWDVQIREAFLPKNIIDRTASHCFFWSVA